MKNRSWLALSHLLVTSGIASAQPIEHIDPAPPYQSDSIGVFRDGIWSLDMDRSYSWDDNSDFAVQFGLPGDQPVVFTAPTCVPAGQPPQHANIAVVRGENQWLETSDWGGYTSVFYFGEAGIPLARRNGVYNTWPGSSLAVMYSDSQAGTWIIDQNDNHHWGSGDRNIVGFGQLGDRPVFGVWAENGEQSMGVFNDGTWWLDINGNETWDAGDTWFAFGSPGDLPVTIRFASAGVVVDRIGVFQNGVWSIDANGNHQWDGVNGGDVAWAFGQPGDIPVVAHGHWKSQTCVSPPHIN